MSLDSLSKSIAEQCMEGLYICLIVRKHTVMKHVGNEGHSHGTASFIHREHSVQTGSLMAHKPHGRCQACKNGFQTGVVIR